MNSPGTATTTGKETASERPFVCHGTPHPGKPCTARLTQAEAWVPTLEVMAKASGRWPTLAKHLTDHIHCGRCSALGRRAGLRFYSYQKTVVEMERRRIRRIMAARQAFAKYLPQDTSQKSSAAGAMPAASADQK